MADIELSMEAIGLITEAEKRLRARIRDAVDEGDRIVFITEHGHLGQALGKEAKNLALMRDLLKKDVKFVEWDEDQQLFIRNLFKPFDLVSVRMETQLVGADGKVVRPQAAAEPEGDDEAVADGDRDADANVQLGEAEAKRLWIRAIVEVTPDDKGKAIGKGGHNIASIRRIAKRHHAIDEVQVI